jgi:hypothetical protein
MSGIAILLLAIVVLGVGGLALAAYGVSALVHERIHRDGQDRFDTPAH